MITTGQLRVFSVSFLKLISRREFIQENDIRYIKADNGVFPRKFVAGSGGEYKETPYTKNDTFILFDVLQEKNISSERIGNITTSMLPFKLIVNIYGEACEDEVQHMMMRLHASDVRRFLLTEKYTLLTEPTEFVILDGRENAQWWKRRRIEFQMNTQQKIGFADAVNEDEIVKIKSEIITIGGLE